MRVETLLIHPAVQALGWSLLHFLWQGALLALLLGTIQMMAPASAARFRYAAASVTMLLMPLALALTMARGFVHEPVVKFAPLTPVSSLAAASAVADFAIPDAPGVGVPGWAVCIWLAGVLLLSLRAAGGWMRAQRLKRGAAPAEQELQRSLQRLKLLLQISAPVRFCISAMVEVPTVIGWMRPYVLLPVTALTGLTDAQLEAVLAHELAHIRRHDYLMNLLQTAIETLLFYHPAVWWVGRQMRLEREHCCDDVAVSVCGSAAEYAGALAELEHIRCGALEPALAATGGDLLGRIRRVLGTPVDRTSRPPGTIAAAVLVLCLTIFPATRTLHAAPQTSSQPAASTPPSSSSVPQPPAPPANAQRARVAGAAPRPPELPELVELPELPDLLAQDQSVVQADQLIAQISQAVAQVDKGVAQLGKPVARTPEERAKTTDFLIKLFDSEKSPDMKESVLSYLARSDDQRAAAKLLAIARSDPDQEMRMAAMSWVARGTKSYDALASLYDNEKNAAMKIALLGWIARSPDPKAADKLMSIVQSDSNQAVREAALSWLVRR